MKRAVLLATLALFSAPNLNLRAQAQEPGPVQLEFVRKLREKGYADLALQYLEKLQKAAPKEVQKAKAKSFFADMTALLGEPEPPAD